MQILPQLDVSLIPYIITNHPGGLTYFRVQNPEKRGDRNFELSKLPYLLTGETGRAKLSKRI